MKNKELIEQQKTQLFSSIKDLPSIHQIDLMLRIGEQLIKEETYLITLKHLFMDLMNKIDDKQIRNKERFNK
jgi:hypothetical protein